MVITRCPLLSEYCKRSLTRHQRSADISHACAEVRGGWQISNWTAGSWSLDEKKTQQSFTVEDLTRSVRKWPARWKESLWREVRSWWPSSSVSLHISRVQKLALSSLNTHACGANVLTWPGLLPFKSENTVSGRKWLRSTLHLSAQPTKLCRFC